MRSAEIAFEDGWRELRPGLEGMLRARGAAPDVVDDVLQETSIRLLKVWDRLDHDRPLTPLARTIACNCLIDLHRVTRPIPVEEVPDEPSGYDLEEHALARVRLARAEAALDSLPSADRTALLAEVGVGPRRNSSAAKMARLRARKRLTAAMDRVAAAFGGIQLAWRRAGLWLHELRPVGEPFVPVMTSVAGVLTVAVLGMSADPGGLAAPVPHRIQTIEKVSQQRVGHRNQGQGRVPAQRKASMNQERPAEVVAAPEAPASAPESSSSGSTVVDTGTANAKTRDGKAHKGVEVCTGGSTADEDDDHSASINVDYGEDDDSGKSCP